MKRLFMFIAAALVALSAAAQGPMPLPKDTTIVEGTLPNGMTYYIRHNDKPAQRAEFYLATNVGAFQEADDQDGLAHFLEHMCFNGTKNFPGKALLNYLQSIGAEFGRNINASTGFEQTKYMLNNIPIVRESIIDSCLLVMHDYSHFVTCDPEEIDAERGVILEERRTRRNAGWRMFEQTLPYYFPGTPYAKRTLIGGEEQLKTFKPESLTSFYHKWYQPDMQALVVVGDIDVNAVEAKIKSIFSDIPAPQAPTVKPEYMPELNEEPTVAIITDAEASGSSLEILWKCPAFPKELMNTTLGLTVDVVTDLFGDIMSERFDDIASNPASPFLSANMGYGNICNECGVMSGIISFKDGQAVPAFVAFMTEVEKMRRFGFTDAEVQRAKDNLISYYEKKVEAAQSRKNPDFIIPILNNFFFNRPLLDPEMELEIVKSMLSQINSTVIKQITEQLFPGFIADNFITVVFNGPQKEGLESPAPEDIKAIISSVKEMQIEANGEEVEYGPLVDAKKLKGGKIVKEETGIYGTTVWTLKNGLKVIVKPTDFKKDQVSFKLYEEGGKMLIADSDLYSFEDNVWQVFTSNAGVSKFPQTVLSKMLAGKHVSAQPFVGGTQHGINASSTPKDIETALQLMYLTFADMRFDPTEYENGMEQIRAVLPNLESQPMFRLQNEIASTVYGNNPRVISLNSENFAKVDLNTMKRVYKSLFNNVSGATLIITGNVDLESLKPLVTKYMGALPKGKTVKLDTSKSPRFAEGKVENHFTTKMETPKVSVLQVYSANSPYSITKDASLSAAKFILDMIYTETLREEEGGTYGASVVIEFNREPEDNIIAQVYFDTNTESADKLAKLAVSGMKELAETGGSQAQVEMAKENLKKNMPEDRISNYYWMKNIENYNSFGTDYDAQIDAAINAISQESIKAALGEVLATGNFIEIIMSPQE